MYWFFCFHISEIASHVSFQITDGGGEDEDRVAPVQVPSLSQEPACATPEHQHPPPEGAPSITAEDKHLPDPEPANQKCSSKLSSLPAHKSDIAGVDSCVVNPDHSDNDLDLISGDAKVLIPVGVKDSASKMGGVMGTESEDECKGGRGIQDDEEGEKADLVATDDHHMDLDEFSSKTEELLSTVTLMSQLEATKTSEMFSKIDRETKLDLDIEGTTPGGHEKSEDTEIQKQDDLIECETEAELLVELPPEIHELCLELPPESHTESNSTEAEMKTEEGKIVPSVSPVEDQPSDNSECEVEDIILFDHHELVASAKLPTEDASINDTSKKQSDGLTKSDHLETHSADLGKKTCEEEQLVCLALSDPQDLLGACASPGPLSLADMARNVIGQEPAAAAMPKRNEINNVFAANLENVNIGASALSLTTESPEPHLISALPDVLIKGDTDKPTSTKNDYSCGKSVDRGSRASSESEIEILSEENNTSMTNSLTKSLDLDIKYTKSPIDARSRRGPSEGAISDASSEIDVLCEESLPADPVQLQSQISDEAKGMEPLTEATELPSPVSPIQDDLTSLADSAYASLGRGYETEGSTASLHEETVLPVDSPNKNCAEEVEPTPDDTCSIPDVENESSHSKSKSTGSISDLSAKEDTSREINTDKTDSQWSKAEDFEVLFGADPRFAMIRPKGSDSAQTDRCDKCMESDSIETMFGADPRIVSTSCMHASAVGMDPWHKCAAELPKEAAMLFGDDPRFGTQTSLHSDTHVYKEKDDSCTLPLKSEPVTCEEDDSSDGEIIEELIEDECELPKEAAMLFGDDPRFGTQTSLHSDTHVHKEKDDSCTLPLKSEPVTCEEDDSSDGEIIEELIEDECELPKEAAILFGDDPRFGTQTSLHSDTHVHKEKDDSCTLPLKSEPVTCEEDDSSDGEIIEELIEDECATEPLLEPELNYEPNAGKGSTSECDIGKQIDLQCTSKELHDELDCYEKSTLLQNAVLEGNAVPQSDHSNTSTYAEKLKPSMEKQDPDCDITMSDSDVEGTLSTIDDNLITQGNTETDSQSKTNDGALSYRIEGRDYHKEQWQSAFKKVIGGEVDGGETKSDSGVQQCPGETSSKDDQCAPLLTSPCEESSRPKSPAKLRWQKAYEKVCEEELKEGALPSETAAKPCASGATSSLVVESDHPVTEQHPNDETTMKQRWKGAIEKVIDEVEQPQIDKDISPDEAVLPEFSPHLLVPKQSDERPQSPVKEKWQGAFKRIVGEDPPRLSDLPAHYRVSGVGNTTKVHKTGANDAVSDIGKTFELVEPTVEGIGSSSLENSYKADDMEEPSWYDMLLQDSESGSEVEAASQELDDISNELSSGSGFQTIPQAETKSDRAAGNRASLSGTVLYPEWMKKASGTAERPVSPFPSARHEPLSVECDETEPDYVDYVDEERILPRLERSPSLDDIEDKDEEKASEKLEGAPTKVALALQAEEKSGSSGSDPDLNIIKLSDYWEECSDGGLHSESPDPEMFSKALQDYREKKSTLATQNPELASSKIDPDEYEKAVLGDGANNLIDTYLPGQGADSQDVVRTLHSGDDASGQPTGDGCCNSDKCEAHDHESCVVPDMELHRADVNITESILHPSTISQESEGMTPGIQTAEVVDLDKDSLDGDLEDSLEEEASNVLGSKNVELSHIKAIGNVSSHDDDVLSCDSLEDTPGFHYPLPRTSSPSTMSQDSLGDEPSQSLDVAVPEERSHCIEDIDSSFTDDSIEQEEEGQLTGSQLEATVFELEHTPTRETAESSFDRDSLNATGGSFTHSFGIDVIQEEPDQAEGVEEGKRTHSESAKFAPSKIPRRNKRRKVKGGSNPTRNFQYPEDSTAL